MNKPKFRAWDKHEEEMLENVTPLFDESDNMIAIITDFRLVGSPGTSEIEIGSYDTTINWDEFPYILMQYSGMHDNHDYSDIYEDDLLEIESPKGKFIAKVESCYGTWGITAIKGEVVDYFEDHWCDSFMPLIDLYWNENGDDGCLPKSRRLGSIHANPELLNEVN